jgi:hypothetical protein
MLWEDEMNNDHLFEPVFNVPYVLKDKQRGWKS